MALTLTRVRRLAQSKWPRMNLLYNAHDIGKSMILINRLETQGLLTVTPGKNAWVIQVTKAGQQALTLETQ